VFWVSSARVNTVRVVRLSDGAAPLELDAVRDFLADRLADYKLPRRLVVRRAPLPRSGTHKVDKKALLAELAKLAE
jgi:acyl-CoA synthetase (AMP-forming)/AMP-acid ligase II